MLWSWSGFGAMRSSPLQTIDKYRIYERFASGGMGSVHLGRRFAAGGFRRTVVVKRLHPQFAESPDFVTAFLDEARLASRIHHPNVVSPTDVIARDGEVLLVFEHVLGLPLSVLQRRAVDGGQAAPLRIVASIMMDVLHGLHAAHEARGDTDEPLGLVHRDVTPQNILVGRDGVARLLDFGIAKAVGRAQITDEGIVKGKPGYMAPEHMRGQVTRASDLYSAAVVLWELLANRRLFDDSLSLMRATGVRVDAPSAVREGPPAPDHAGPAAALLDAIALRGLEPSPEGRFATAREMSIAIEGAGVATAREVGDWVERVGHAELAERTRSLARVESLIDEAPLADDVVFAATEAATGPTSASIATVVDDPPLRDRGGGLLTRLPMVAALAATGLLGALVVSLWPGADAAPASEPSPAAIAAPQRPAPVVEPPSAAPASQPVPDIQQPPSSPAPSESASAGSRSRSASRSPDDRRARAKARAAARRRPRDQKPCEPTRVDQDGRVQFNEACLR